MKDFFSEKKVHGRRTYQCDFCRREISKGTLHYYIACSSLGDHWTKRAHLACYDVTKTAAPAIGVAIVDHKLRVLTETTPASSEGTR